MEKFIKKYYKLIVVIIMAFFLTVSLLNAKNDAAIYDETAHIPAGYSYLTQHDMRLNPEHPPLLKDLAAFPLLFLHLNFNTDQTFWKDDINGQWDAGHYFLYDAGNNPDTILFWARVPIVIISVLLGLFLFMWAKEIAGVAAGLFILVLYAFDPNILGHNHYVTTDVGIAAFMTFSAYFFLKFIKKPSWTNTFLGGLFLGLVHLTKFSSVILLPVYGIILIIYPLIKKISHDEKENKKASLRLKTFGEYLFKGIIAFFISFAVIWILYYFNTYRMPQDNLAKTIDYYFPADDTNPTAHYARIALVYLNGASVLRPWGEYLLGVFMVFKRVAGGNGAYFLGQVSNKAFPAYFPVVFLIKESIPFLFLILFSLVYTVTRIIKRIHTSENLKSTFVRFLQTGVLKYGTFAFIILYAYLSITGNLNIGLRHLFPILPFAYLLVTIKVFEFLKNSHIATQKAFWWTSLIIICWIIVIPFLNYPGYVSYFNELVGGSKNGYKYVTDSNTDWGQDLKRLKYWINDYNHCAQTKCDPNLGVGCPSSCYEIAKLFPTPLQPIDKIRVDYFGGGDVKYYLDDTATQWSDNIRPIEKGWYAISTNYIQGSVYDKEKPDDESYRWLENYKPVTMIGNSILVYYIENPPAN